MVSITQSQRRKGNFHKFHGWLSHCFAILVLVLWIPIVWIWMTSMNQHNQIRPMDNPLSRQTPPKQPRLKKRVMVQERSYECEQGLHYIPNVIPPSSLSETTHDTFKIPRRVFQTSKSKCVVWSVALAIRQWQFQGWEYYLFDDQNLRESLERLAPKNNSIMGRVIRNCLVHGTLKADLWRYAILWEYGGIYADIDTRPNLDYANSEEMWLLWSSHDAVFVVEQYHLLSQYFMAISPKHPLMKYAMEYALNNVLQHPDVYKINAAYTTGPHALHKAFQQFCQEASMSPKIIDPAGTGYKPVQAGTYFGTNNRTVTAVGTAENQNQYITRDFLSYGDRKARVYQAMGMTHFLDQAKQQNATGISCWKLIFSS